MKRFLPKTLPVWVLVIVISGLLATQAAFLSIMSADREESNKVVELYRLNERALWLVKLLSAADETHKKALSATLSNATFAVDVSQYPAVTSSIAADDTLAELEDIMMSRLARFGIVDARVLQSPAISMNSVLPSAGGKASENGEVENDLETLAEDFRETDRYTVSLQFKDGQWVNFVTPKTPLGPVLAPESLPAYIAVALCISALSIWAIRRLTAPYVLLEAAVTRLGEDFKSPPLSETGSREYRSAARAVNAMQERLLEFVEDREYLAAALAHDLRTPITKMRLRLELLRNSAVRSALAGDIANVELTVRSVIDFVKLRVSEEKAEKIDFWSLVYAIVDEYADASIDNDDLDTTRLLCEVQPTALRRCIMNLIDNAIKYGSKAHITVSSTEDRISLVIVDEGPGIPEARLEDMFRPFKRVENSRSRETGGAGLGLTIARGLIRKMGGDISLSNASQGGLRVELNLPRQKQG